MRRQLSWSAVVLMIWVCQVSAATRYVGSCHGSGSYAKINDAVKIAVAGDTIRICPGLYLEQVIISKALTLEGLTLNGQGLVQISNPTDGSVETTPSTVTGYSLTPIIWVVGTSANISNILVGGYSSGGLCDSSTPVYNIGVGFYYGNGSSGTLNNAASNVSCGAGVWLENSSDLGAAVKVENSVIWGDLYGIFAGGGPHQTGTMPLLRATITGNQVEHGQYGIYIADIGGTVSNNTIDCPAFPTSIVIVYPYSPSVGVMDAAPDAEVTGNRITQEVTGIETLTANVIVTSNRILSNGGTQAGIDLHCFLGNVSNNMLQIRGGEDNDSSFGITDVPAGFTLVNHFYSTTNLQSSRGC
jgi:hypothetical protein